MKKPTIKKSNYRVILHFEAGFDYEVLAKSEDEAERKARRMAEREYDEHGASEGEFVLASIEKIKPSKEQKL